MKATAMRCGSYRLSAGWIFACGSLFVLLCLSLLIFANCNKIEPEPPPEQVPAQPPEPVLSSVNAPLKIAVSELCSIANRKIRDSLYFKSGIDLDYDLKLQIDIRRDGLISMSAEQGSILTDVPIKATGRIDWQMPVGIGTLSHHVDLDARLLLILKSEITVDENWSIVPHTSIDFSWVKRPVINFAGLNIDLSGLAEKEIEKQLIKLSPELDEMLSGLVDLPKLMKPVWNDIRHSVSIKKNPAIWLRANPVAVTVSPVKSRNDTLIINFGIEAYIETILGKKPEPIEPKPLPLLSLKADTLNACHITLSASIKYKDADKILTTNLADRIYTFNDKATVQILDVYLYGNGDFVVLGINFKASGPGSFIFNISKGQLLLTGKPVYNAETKMLRIESLDFDLNTKNVLANTAGWMLSEKFIRSIQSELVFPLEGKIERAQDELQKVVAKIKLGKFMVVSGQISDLSPLGFYISTTGIQIVVLANGYLQADLKLADNIK